MVAHAKDVVRRVATAGFIALAVDLLARDGGADKLSDRSTRWRPTSVRRWRRCPCPGSAIKLGVTGFCFGGGMVWNALAAGPGDGSGAVLRPGAGEPDRPS
jgi:carboxymethylenebutenolidase